MQVLAVTRHQRKLRRGVHRGNRFTLVLRELQGERDALEQRLQQMRSAGVPNYFGEQRFGRNGSTLSRHGAGWPRARERNAQQARALSVGAALPVV